MSFKCVLILYTEPVTGGYVCMIIQMQKMHARIITEL